VEKAQRPRGRTPWIPRAERMLQKNFTLPPRLIERLEHTADKRKVTASQIVRELLEAHLPPGPTAVDAEMEQGAPQTEGQKLVAELTANGMIGAWKERADIGDSVDYARQLRERVWRREQD
jgi:hypothetical protein